MPRRDCDKINFSQPATYGVIRGWVGVGKEGWISESWRRRRGSGTRGCVKVVYAVVRTRSFSFGEGRRGSTLYGVLWMSGEGRGHTC